MPSGMDLCYYYEYRASMYMYADYAQQLST